MKVVFATPSLNGPTAPYCAALERSLPSIEEAGWEHGLVQELENPYISAARSLMARKALDAKADVIVFIDYDLSWDAGDLLKLIETPGDVVAGTYRFKKEPEEYMGELLAGPHGTPLVRPDGCVKASKAPAGFLKVTKEAVDRFMRAYPNLCYGAAYAPHVDLFNHGAHNGVWWGEDYAFCRNWIDCGGDVWIVPDLNLTHHSKDKAFPGNYHEYLQRLPGGAKCTGSKMNSMDGCASLS